MLEAQARAAAAARGLERGLLDGRRGLHDRHPPPAVDPLSQRATPGRAAAVGRSHLRLGHLAPLRRRGASRRLRREQLPRDPADTRRAFFHERPDGWHVAEPIRQLCHFGQMNLLDEDRSRVLGRADAIFCRNVLIYFDARARKTAIEVLYDRLNPGESSCSATRSRS